MYEFFNAQHFCDETLLSTTINKWSQINRNAMSKGISQLQAQKPSILVY